MNRETLREVLGLIAKIRKVDAAALTTHLASMGYFISPASSKYHGAYPGGLINHSLYVYRFFDEYNRSIRLGLSDEDVIICSLFHDFCKCGAYVLDGLSYKWNKDHPRGHGFLSARIMDRLIELTETQRTIIQYHMGVFGTVEADSYIDEYSFDSFFKEYAKLPALRAFIFSDELATLHEKSRECLSKCL
jgi:hypothetical protein